MLNISGLGQEPYILLYLPDFENYEFSIIPEGIFLNFSQEITKNLGYKFFSKNKRKISCSFTLTSRKDLKNFYNFYHIKKGSFKKFWLPIWFNEFKLIENYTVIDNPIVKIEQNYIYQNDYSNLYIFLALKNGDLSLPDIYIRKVISMNLQNTYIELILNQPLNRVIKIEQILYFGRVILARFNDNLNIKVNFVKNNNIICNITTSFIELLDEYNEIQGQDTTFIPIFYS